jgi:DNA primase
MRTQQLTSTARVKSAILAILPDLIRQWLPVGEQRDETYVALNPLRDDRNLGSFQIDTRTGQWRDHAVGRGGNDAVSLYGYLFTNGDYRAALKVLATDPLVRAAIATGAAPYAAKPAKAATVRADKLALVQSIYAEASELPGTPAANYLDARGLRQTAAWKGLRASTLRYAGRTWHPALIAPLLALDGSMVGLHRTYLQLNGRKLEVPAPRLTLGQIRSCAIRLGEPDDHLIICEGLEDGLTLYQELDGHPVWVSGGASLMPAMSIPDDVQCLTIAADNDAVGERAAHRAADAHGTGKRDVRIMHPNAAFKDFNDELRGKTA